MIEKYIKLAYYIVTRHFSRFSRFRADLNSVAVLALVEGLQKYDPERGCPLQKYLYFYILNRCRDFLKVELRYRQQKILNRTHQEPFYDPDLLDGISPVQQEILKLKAQGCSHEEISSKIDYSKRFVSENLWEALITLGDKYNVHPKGFTKVKQAPVQPKRSYR